MLGKKRKKCVKEKFIHIDNKSIIKDVEHCIESWSKRSCQTRSHIADNLSASNFQILRVDIALSLKMRILACPRECRHSS